MKIKVGISNRHIHITKEDYKILFNKEELNKRNDLNQPNNFAAIETVTLKTNKNKIENVRILGPFRNYTQVELTKTDSYKLGINPPVRASGDLKGSENITIEGPTGEITKECCIIADRHIHITKEDYEKYKINKDTCQIKISGEKGAILDNVHFKVTEEAYMELHLDTDDANAMLLSQNDEVEII